MKLVSEAQIRKEKNKVIVKIDYIKDVPCPVEGCDGKMNWHTESLKKIIKLTYLKCNKCGFEVI